LLTRYLVRTERTLVCENPIMDDNLEAGDKNAL